MVTIREARSSDTMDLIRRVLHGEMEYIASHAGHSQYSAGSTSACGLVAMNCARIVLQKERELQLSSGAHLHDVPAKLIAAMMKRETFLVSLLIFLADLFVFNKLCCY